MAALTYRFKVGSFDCRVIADGTGTDDASGVAPVGASLEEWLQALHEHNIPPSQLPYSYNVLFVDTGHQRILVDTGRGGSSGQLLGTLSMEGIQTGDIDVVIITHGHGDHFGGLANDEGKMTFPNARCFMAKGEWDYWISESTLAEMNEQGANRIRNRLIPLEERIERIGDEGEIVPGLYAVPAPGHTPTHMAVLVTSEGEGLLVIADAARHPIQVEHPNWSHPYDRQPDVASETRRRLFIKAANENLLLTAYHFPFPGVGRIHPSGDGWQWQPVG